MASKKKGDADKRHTIDLTWSSNKILQAHNDADIDIAVTSRKLKNQDESPSDCLFRTHQYEFHFTPNERFFQWAGRRAGFIVELKLYRRVASEKGSNPKEEFQEYTSGDRPVISYTYTEDVFSGEWLLNLLWPAENNRINFRGEFCFTLTFYRKISATTIIPNMPPSISISNPVDDVFKIFHTVRSSSFKIYSKPEVFLKAKRKEAAGGGKAKGKNKKENIYFDDDDSNSNTGENLTCSNTTPAIPIVNPALLPAIPVGVPLPLGKTLVNTKLHMPNPFQFKPIALKNEDGSSHELQLHPQRITAQNFIIQRSQVPTSDQPPQLQTNFNDITTMPQQQQNQQQQQQELQQSNNLFIKEEPVDMISLSMDSQGSTKSKRRLKLNLGFSQDGFSQGGGMSQTLGLGSQDNPIAGLSFGSFDVNAVFAFDSDNNSKLNLLDNSFSSQNNNFGTTSSYNYKLLDAEPLGSSQDRFWSFSQSQEN